MRKCENCKVFVNVQPTHCRLVPPTAVDCNNSTFALTKPDWWCAQHKFSWSAIARMLFRFGRKA